MDLPVARNVVAREQLDLGPEAWVQLAAFAGLLLGEGQLAGATAPIDAETADRRHIAESLAFSALLGRRGLLRDGVTVADVGTGGGLPGVPLAVAFPRTRVTLVEASARKTAFLRNVVQRLGLPNVEVITARAETLGRDAAARERFDVVVSRAVAELRVLAELCLPLVAAGGVMAAIKGSRATDEVAAAASALEALGAAEPEIASLGDGGPLVVVFVRKSSPTPARFPRREGVPAKRPL